MSSHSIGPRDISQPHIHQNFAEGEVEHQKEADLALVSDTTSLAKDGTNPLKPTDTAAVLFGLLRASNGR